VPVSCASASGLKSGDTFPIGQTTVTCSATDDAGNTAQASFTVNVVYDFGNGTGGSFSSPISSTMVNEVKAGAIVPVKFGLGGDFGLDIFAQGYPISKQISTSTCQQDPVNPSEVPTTSTSGLKYDAVSGQYIYNWRKTDRAWSKTCRQLIMKFHDGTIQPVTFKFN
jgi:hypothetical protein